jgi:hypothetical protein
MTPLVQPPVPPTRRRLLAAGFAFSPLRGALASLTSLASLGSITALSGCSREEGWPEGMQPIKWDRDTCARCRMVISDRRFAVGLAGAGPRQLFNFDDIGCAAFWLRDQAQAHPWMAEPTTRLWVADVFSRGAMPQWLDARSAQYLTKTSPMGYNFGATRHPQAGSVDFRTMGEHVLARGR